MWEKFVADMISVLTWYGPPSPCFCHDPFATVNFTVEEIKDCLLGYRYHFEERWDINEKVSG